MTVNQTNHAENIIHEYLLNKSNHTLLRRWAAHWIDSVMIMLFLCIPDYFLGNDFYQKTLYIWIPLALLYLPLSEWLTGFTLGKYFAGIRVINLSGKNPSLMQTALRMFTKLFEANPILLGGMIGCAKETNSRISLLPSIYISFKYQLAIFVTNRTTASAFKSHNISYWNLCRLALVILLFRAARLITNT